MLILKILSTVFIGISCLTALIKNLLLLNSNIYNFIFANLYGLCWRALAITTIWLL